MGLNDELEKIRQAEEWLENEPPGSACYNAAKDHLFCLIEWSQDESVKAAAQKAIDRWVDEHKEVRSEPADRTESRT